MPGRLCPVPVYLNALFVCLLASLANRMLLLMQCDDCDGWVHAPCDNLSPADLIAMAASTHPVWGKRYMCPLCRHRTMQRLLTVVREEDRAGHFAMPVSGASAPGYHNVISTPMDLWTIGRLLDAGHYDSPSPSSSVAGLPSQSPLAGINMFRGHFELIIRNAVVFNTPQVRLLLRFFSCS